MDEITGPDYEVLEPKCGMFYPQSTFKTVWDILNSLSLLVTCILTPFNLAFSEELELVTWYLYFNYSIDVFFAIDIIINFNTALVDDDFKVIDSRWEIATTYLRSWFLVDLVSIIPFELIFIVEVAEN